MHENHRIFSVVIIFHMDLKTYCIDKVLREIKDEYYFPVTQMKKLITATLLSSFSLIVFAMESPPSSSSFKTLINSDNGIFWQMPLGKPNTSEQLVDPLNDQRSRKLQKAQKGPTCYFYAGKRLRPVYGKTCGAAFAEKREGEKFFSDIRKDKTFSWSASSEAFKVYEQLWFCIKFAQGNMSAERLDQLIHEKCEKIESNELGSYVKDLLAKFFLWHPNYNNYKKETYEDDLGEFKRFLEDYEGEYVAIRAGAKSGTLERIYNGDLSFMKGTGYASVVVTFSGLDYVKEMCCLEVMPQPKEMSFTLLITTLKKYGPLLAQGFLGIPYYTRDAIRIKGSEMGGKPVYGFPSSARIKDTKDSAKHAVIVVGAIKENSDEYVFIIDPNDPSDPNDPLSQKIYRLRFAAFNEQVSELHFSHALPNFTPVAY